MAAPTIAGYETMGGLAPIEPTIARGVEDLFLNYVGSNCRVEMSPDGFLGTVTLSNGEQIRYELDQYGPHNSNPIVDEIAGFDEDEIGSGISRLIGKINDVNGLQITRHVFISGLSSPLASKARRIIPGHGIQFTDTKLYPEELATVMQSALLTQLVAYVSNSYPDHPAAEAISHFIDDVVSSEPGFYWPPVNGIPQFMDNDQVASIFRTIFGPHRLETDINRHRTGQFTAHLPNITELIETNSYHTRIRTSLEQIQSSPLKSANLGYLALLQETMDLPLLNS